MKQHTTKFAMIVEKSRDGDLYGRVTINQHLMVESAQTLDALKKAMTKLVFDLEGIEIEELEVSYDLTSFFDQYKVNISDIAARAGINAALMRQYAAGIKFPSAERVDLIEKAVHEYARELAKVKLVKTDKASRKKELATA